MLERKAVTHDVYFYRLYRLVTRLAFLRKSDDEEENENGRKKKCSKRQLIKQL